MSNISKHEAGKTTDEKFNVADSAFERGEKISSAEVKVGDAMFKHGKDKVSSEPECEEKYIENVATRRSEKAMAHAAEKPKSVIKK